MCSLTLCLNIYLFIIEQLAKEFKGSFDCLGENTEKYITFSVHINIEYDNDTTVTYKLEFIDSYKFMQSSLSSLVDNLQKLTIKNRRMNLLITLDL